MGSDQNLTFSEALNLNLKVFPGPKSGHWIIPTSLFQDRMLFVRREKNQNSLTSHFLKLSYFILVIAKITQ